MKCSMKDEFGARCKREALYDARLPMPAGNVSVGVGVCAECRETYAEMVSFLTADPSKFRQLMLGAMMPIKKAALDRPPKKVEL